MTRAFDTYNTPEWREARDTFIAEQGGVCEMCGHKEGDVVTVVDIKGHVKNIVIKLNPHHKEKIKLGIGARNKLITKLFNAFSKNKILWERLKDLAVGELGDYVDSRDIRARMKTLWYDNNKQLVDKEYQKYKQAASEQYLILTPATAYVTCQRCHYAREKGLLLCKKCGLYYHKPKYRQCYRCGGM